MSETPTMKIATLAPWFGGKRTLAPRIVAELGKHRVYWELFGGGLSVLLSKPPCVMETANDMHGQLVNLARCVQTEDAAIALFDRASRTAMHEELFEEQAASLRDLKHEPAPESPSIDQAYAYLVVSWLGMNGVAGTKSHNHNFCVRYTANGGHAAKRWRSVCDSIPAWWDRLRNVTMLNRDAFDLLDRIDDAPGTAIYLDPPYVTKGAKYVHDFSGIDHLRLAKLASRFKNARVVISYYEHPSLLQWYDGWTFVSCPTSKSLVSSGKRASENAIKAPEVLIVNGPSLSAGGEW